MHIANLRRAAGRTHAGRWALLLALAVVPASTMGTAVAQDSASVSVTRGTEATPFAYEPETVNVASGATVTWSNPQLHTTGSAEDHPTNCRQGNSKGTCPWASEPLPPGGTFQVTFPEEGTFNYFCAVHPYMVGTVVVGDGEPNAAEPSEEPTQEPEPDPQPTAAPESTASAEAPGSREPTEAEAASDEPTDDASAAPTTSPTADEGDDDAFEAIGEAGESLGEAGEALGEAGEAIVEGLEGAETVAEAGMRSAVRVFAALLLLVAGAAMAVAWRRRRG